MVVDGKQEMQVQICRACNRQPGGPIMSLLKAECTVSEP
jgi:hypothetical protein